MQGHGAVRGVDLKRVVGGWTKVESTPISRSYHKLCICSVRMLRLYRSKSYPRPTSATTSSSTTFMTATGA